MIIESKEIKGDTRLVADVCVVGSGASGSVVAKELAWAGMRVVVLEEGGYFTSKDFPRKEADAYTSMYREHGLLSNIDFSVPMLVGSCVGGGTVVNGAMCMRAPDFILNGWRDALGIEGFGPQEMKPSFRKVEKMINAVPIPDENLNEVSTIMKKGMEALGYKELVLKRNVKDCRGCGVCICGCPEDHKQTMLHNYLPAAMEKGTVVYANCRVDEIIIERGTARGLRGTVLDGEELKPRHSIQVEAGLVILAAGAIGTPQLLLRSGIRGITGRVGAGLSLIPVTQVLGYFDKEVCGFQGVPCTTGTDQFLQEGLLIDGALGPPLTTAMIVPSFGMEHRELMKNYRHLAAVIIGCKDEPNGRVRLGFKGLPTITYWLDGATRKRLAKAFRISSSILLAAGAREAFLPTTRKTVIRTEADIERITPGLIKRNSITVGGGLVQGTCRMGNDPRTSVVTAKGRVHGYRNLFVCDSSIIPEPIAIHPQVTIMAMADRIAGFIKG